MTQHKSHFLLCSYSLRMEQYKAENTINIYGECISWCQSQVYICPEYVIAVTKPDADN